MTLISFLLGFMCGTVSCAFVGLGAYVWYVYIDMRADDLERADQDLRRSNNTSRGAAPL